MASPWPLICYRVRRVSCFGASRWFDFSRHALALLILNATFDMAE
ncbi:MAG: hypothetical protein N838_30660 [Thiohalocapsa sp. PB-PSB1]|nr:MAG: hypothetical protein N838_30660 [Thiohalocapsa sp. PB-PSB1]